MKNSIIVFCCFIFVLGCNKGKQNQNNNTVINDNKPIVEQKDSIKQVETIVEKLVYDTVPLLEYPSFLYNLCGNIVTLKLPFSYSNQKIEALNATILPTQDPLKFVVFPYDKNCNLILKATRMDSSQYYSRKNFKTIEPPKPEILLLVDGVPFNGTTPINKNSSFKLKLIPDAFFSELYPKDSRYNVSKIDVLVQRSLGAPTLVASFSGSGKNPVTGIDFSLGNNLNNDPPGTKIYFTINHIYRINFKNGLVPEKFQPSDLIIGAIIK